MMNKYYEVEAIDVDGDREVLYGSFDKKDCTYEIEAEKSSWKGMGYKKIKITSRDTEDSPDPEVYGNGDNYTVAVLNAMKDPEVTFSVSDSCEEDFDLEDSRSIADIIEAAEATDSPVITFFKNGESIGYMLVLVGYGDESIADYGMNPFMDSLLSDII